MICFRCFNNQHIMTFLAVCIHIYSDVFRFLYIQPIIKFFYEFKYTTNYDVYSVCIYNL